MKKYSIPPAKLCARVLPKDIPYASSRDIPAKVSRKSPQKRVLEALELGLFIRSAGYNIFLVGEPDLGRRYMLHSLLEPRAKKEPSPPDLLYVYNFANPDAPCLVSLPAGQGKKLKSRLSETLARLQKEVATRLEHASFLDKRSSLMDKLQSQRSRLLKKMSKMASNKGFSLSLDEDGGMMLYPMQGGRRMADDELENLDDAAKNQLKILGDSLMDPMSGLMRQMARAEESYLAKERSLEKEIVEGVLVTTLDALAEKTCAACTDPALQLYFADMRKDILENYVPLFLEPGGNTPKGTPASPRQENTSAADLKNGSGPAAPLSSASFLAGSIAIPAGASPATTRILTKSDQIQGLAPICFASCAPVSAVGHGQGSHGQGQGGYSQGSPGGGDSSAADDIMDRYNINVFVDNSEASGAPLIFEDHPTLSNLMGSIEREAEMGALVTHFSLIKSGAVHRANGGYLVVHAEDLLRHPGAWESLIRSLRSGVSRIDDAGEDEGTKTKGLQPDPVPLSLKVILVGNEDLYEVLLDGDERFSKLFKIKAHMTEHMPRNKNAVYTYMAHIKNIIENDMLLPFTRCALAGLVDYGSRLIEDQQRLSLKYPLLREIMIEASALAAMKKKTEVDAAILGRALDARSFRSNLVEEAYMEEYDRRIIKVVTSGRAVGRINGLAVSFYGNYEFGLPHQISCTVGAGSGGIIDLERDAQLGGPIHTKAMMILKTYLVGAFAHNKPLILTGSLGFEQNYVGIEGDSASGAELAALLSALSGVPLDLSTAFTGAVGQSGEIMAVGGVTRKIEGYFQVCKRHGLTGRQGVILPRDNIAHLMLHNEVIEAVEQGQFHVYAVEHITEALELLTGMSVGKRRKNGTYTPGSLYDLADKRLTELAKIASAMSRGRGR